MPNATSPPDRHHPAAVSRSHSRLPRLPRQRPARLRRRLFQLERLPGMPGTRRRNPLRRTRRIYRPHLRPPEHLRRLPVGHRRRGSRRTHRPAARRIRCPEPAVSQLPAGQQRPTAPRPASVPTRLRKSGIFGSRRQYPVLKFQSMDDSIQRQSPPTAEPPRTPTGGSYYAQRSPQRGVLPRSRRPSLPKSTTTSHTLATTRTTGGLP